MKGQYCFCCHYATESKACIRKECKYPRGMNLKDIEEALALNKGLPMDASKPLKIYISPVGAPCPARVKIL